MDYLLNQAEQIDENEDAKYGKGKKDNDLLKELKFRQSRLQKLQEAKQALEEETKADAELNQKEYESKKSAYDKKNGRRGRPPKPPSDKPNPKKQRNFTDPESRIMQVSGGKDFVQGYNCQAAVDKEAQVIVFRGLAACRQEWDLVYLTHNLLKLFRQKPHQIRHKNGDLPFCRRSWLG